jgi:hypothetical protein
MKIARIHADRCLTHAQDFVDGRGKFAGMVLANRIFVNRESRPLRVVRPYEDIAV